MSTILIIALLASNIWLICKVLAKPYIPPAEKVEPEIKDDAAPAEESRKT